MGADIGSNRAAMYSFAFIHLAVPLAYWSWWFSGSMGTAERWFSIAGAYIATFFAIGTIRMGVVSALDFRLISRAMNGELPHDGKCAAVVGYVRPDTVAATSPFSGSPCVAYRYEVSLKVNCNDVGPVTNAYYASTETVFAGVRLISCHIDSNGDTCSLNGLPSSLDSTPNEVDFDDALARARRFLIEPGRLQGQAEPTPIDKMTYENMTYEWASTYETRELERHWQYCNDESLANLKLESSSTQDAWRRAFIIPDRPRSGSSTVTRFTKVRSVELNEFILRPDELVCVIGVYVASDRAIRPAPWKGLRVFMGDPVQRRRSIAFRSIALVAAGVVGLVVIQFVAAVVIQFVAAARVV